MLGEGTAQRCDYSQVWFTEGHQCHRLSQQFMLPVSSLKSHYYYRFVKMLCFPLKALLFYLSILDLQSPRMDMCDRCEI